MGWRSPARTCWRTASGTARGTTNTCTGASGSITRVWCFRARPGAPSPGGSTGLLAARATGERDFTPTQKRLVELAVAAVAPLVGGALAGFADPSPSELPPRTRQVLKCLLEGDGDKQVAARLGIAVLTVNQHTKRIYAHFGVRSRAELLARWVRRGWGAGAGWAD